MSIEINEDTNLFGDAVAAAPDVDRDTLSRALYAALKDITLDDFVAMFTNPFEAVVDYANLCIGEKTGQRISLIFNPHRLDTGTKRFPISLYAALKDPKFVHGLARVVLLNKKKGATKDLLYASVGMGVQGTSYVQEFPPAVARDLAIAYGMSKRCRILDPCAGWGGRMLGFSAVVNDYTCCEPSARTAAGLRQILTFIQSFRGDFNAAINEAPFEDVELPAQTFDFAFTSPPYYDTERYAPGEATNSFNRYASFSEWCVGFYAPLIHRTMRALKPGACFVINIGSRLYPLNEKLMEIAAGKYDVTKDKDRLSASNGLGKTGEGETFYEVKNPGLYVEPEALPVVVAPLPDAVVSESTTGGSPTEADVSKLLQRRDDDSAASAADEDIDDSMAANPEDTARTDTTDDAATFNPLDAFLSAPTTEPATASPDASSGIPEASTLDDTPSAPEVPRQTAHAVEQLMIGAGHQLFARHGKLVVTNASQLSDEHRAIIKERRDELLIIVPTFPEEQKQESIVQFLGQPQQHVVTSDWKIEMPPSLDGITELEMDFETTGLQWWSGDRPADKAIGFSLRLPGGKKKYYPFGHVNAPGQLIEAQVKQWAKDHLKNKRITNAYTIFDVHTSREWGVDLVEQGCTFSDVMHYAALLDDHRKRFALNELAKDYLGREKVGMDLDPTRMAYYEPWMVAQRAEGDVETVAELKAIMWPLLDQQGLQQVRALEDRIIPVVVEMEKNGAPINRELLATMTRDSEAHYYQLIKQVSEEAGFNFDDSDASWIRLFERFKIPLVFNKKKDSNEASDKPTFKDAVLARIEHPTIKVARFASQLDSLRSKIFKPYTELVGSDGLLRTSFNQLRLDDEHGQRGTVSGRFSAAYVQQVPNHDNHAEVFGDLYYPRALYEPGPGMLFFAGDAAQIEYRIFASHAKNKGVLEAYRQNPAMSFHKMMWPKITRYRPDFSYSNMKNFNFMCVAVDTPTLTADLRWVPVGLLKEGDQLLTMDEHAPEHPLPGRGRTRRWRIADVLHNSIEQRECAEILLENGDRLIATLDHPWLAFRRNRDLWKDRGKKPRQGNTAQWLRTLELQAGDELTRYVKPWEPELSWESGWLAGFLDGEGCATSADVRVNQNAGPTLDFAHDLLRQQTANVGWFPDSGSSTTEMLRIQGPVHDRLRFLGRVRPQRLIPQFVNSLNGGMSQVEEYVKVISITPVGMREIAALGTSSFTYLANGYGSHNTIYGGGVVKTALMMGMITEAEADEITKNKSQRTSPKLALAREIQEIYAREMPEAGPLTRKAMHLAMPDCNKWCNRADENHRLYKHRGFVKTILGRRSRFPTDYKIHKALNAIIQGSAADIMKTKLVEVFERRKELNFTMRSTIHDEVTGDVPDVESAAKIDTLLNVQSLPMEVPILWETGTGKNWAEAK